MSVCIGGKNEFLIERAEFTQGDVIVVYGGGKYLVFAKYISLGYKIHFYSPVIQVAHEQSEFRHRQEREKQINERQGVLSFVEDKLSLNLCSK